MGGSLSNKRLERTEFLDLIAKLEPKLSAMLGDVQHQMVPYYRLKKDFGDVDYVVKADAGDVIPKVEAEFKPESMSINDGIISFTFDNFQVDLICTLRNYETAVAYFSYNDIGNLLGRVYHKLGLKFGHEGLLFPLRDDRGSVRTDVVVSTDIEKIISFIGCSYKQWLGGFNTMEEMFRFVASSQYFDRSIYEGELSAINKKRDKKRKTFSHFLSWLEIAQPENRYAFKSREARDEYIPAIEAYFGVSIAAQKAELEAKLAKERAFKEKFNGDLLMMLTPLKGAQLGSFLGQFKKYVLKIEGPEITREHNDAFENLILSMDQDDINQSIIKFYDGTK